MDRNRELAELLGICWHEPIEAFRLSNIAKCTCGKAHSRAMFLKINHSYGYAQDMVNLAKRLVEVGRWDSFFSHAHFCIDKTGGWKGFDPIRDDALAVFAAWLITDPARTCDLIGEYLEKTA